MRLNKAQFRVLIIKVGVAHFSHAQMQKAQRLVREFATLIEATISSSGSVQEYEEYAAKMSKYLRSKFSLYGLKAGERRELQKEWSETNKEELKNRSEYPVSFIRRYKNTKY